MKTTYYIAYSIHNIIYADYFDLELAEQLICPDNIKEELDLHPNTIIISWIKS